MPLFAYKALNNQGSVTTGEFDAADRTEALKLLDRRGLQPVSLRESATAAAASVRKTNGKAKPDDKAKPQVNGKDDKIPEGPIKLKRQEVVLFTEELSDMLSAGLQLEPALKSMENRQELGNLKAVSFKIRQVVRDGVNFSVALKKASPSFGPLYCSLAAAGEASGALDTILKRQTHYLKTLAELQSRLILAMIYPIFLIRSGTFPPLLIDMVSVGEQTGKIDISLCRAAERYDKELDKDLQRIMALIMPTVLIIMACLIGTMAYLMITAIFQTISALH